MTEVSTLSLSVIPLNVHRLNSPIKRQTGKIVKKKQMVKLCPVNKRLMCDPKTQVESERVEDIPYK